MNRPQGERHQLPHIWNTVLSIPTSQAKLSLGVEKGAPPITLLLILEYNEAALIPVAHSDADDRHVSLKV